MLSLLEKVLLSQIVPAFLEVILFNFFFFFFPLSLSLLFSCCLHLYVCSYDVATADCPRAPRNKLLI